MTQSTMRIHPAATPAPKSAPKQSQAAKQKPKTTNAYASSNQKHDEQKAPQRTADTPSDVLANAAAETKRDKGVYASMKRAFSPHVENHSHAVLYGIIGFVAAALILIVGFWPTVLLAVFAAIGVVIGGAFGKISTSLVNDIIMPLISMITGGIDFSDWKLVLNEAVIDTQGTVVTPELAINYGNLISVILDFIIIAFAIFCVIKAINRLHKKPEEVPVEEPAPPEPSAEEKLLTEIRDLLKERS